ncbi:NAD synthetase [Pseudomonas guariconensis]|uniref:NAD synthetase n=1 Tax=Pseudomonas guariconensis TaxID=1288410 RepID=UPI0018AC12E6|nr:NAD synthetase [Pseudomonas guariconensis]MBF8755558.1 NAD synthetase [Pseudomonas guariconensis]
MRLTRLDELGARPSTYLARMRVEQLIDLPRLFAVIDADPALVGAGVVYIDAQYNIVNLRRFQAVCSVVPKRVVIQELRRHVTPQQYVEQVQRGSRESRLFAEVANAGLACAGAILSGVIMIGGGGFSAVSAGLALPLFYLGAAGTVAAAGQCLIGGIRSYHEYHDRDRVDALDSQEWYRIVSQLLDAISLLGVTGWSVNTIRFLQIRKAKTGLSWLRLLQPLSRQQRKALTYELMRLKHPSLTKKQLKLAQRAGEVKKRLVPAEVNRATSVLIQEFFTSLLTVVGSSRVQVIAISFMEFEQR